MTPPLVGACEVKYGELTCDIDTFLLEDILKTLFSVDNLPKILLLEDESF